MTATTRGRAVIGRLLPPLIATTAVIGIWYAISYGTMDANRRRVILPSPHDVVSDGFLNWRPRSGFRPIVESMLVTGRVALVGLALACALGTVVAVVMNLGRSLERAIFPLAVLVQTVPIVALVPLVRIWFGSGFGSRVVACVLISFFPVLANTVHGLRSVDRGLHDLFDVLGVRRLRRLFLLELPAAFPSILAGFRIAAGASVIGAIVGDFFFSQGETGLGRLIQNHQRDLRTTELIAATIVSSLFGVAIFAAFGLLARRSVGRWHGRDVETGRR
jgi:NitT/TauT family transport system permease protein